MAITAMSGGVFRSPNGACSTAVVNNSGNNRIHHSRPRPAQFTTQTTTPVKLFQSSGFVLKEPFEAWQFSGGHGSFRQSQLLCRPRLYFLSQ